jgi:hypothetical protein
MAYAQGGITAMYYYYLLLLLLLYFSVCKSMPGQEPFRNRTCHNKKQVCKQYTGQTHTFMINHTGQQNIHNKTCQLGMAELQHSGKTCTHYISE